MDTGKIPLITSEENNFYQVMFDSAAEGMLVVDHQGAILSANPRAHELFGFETGEMNGLKVEALIPKKYAGSHAGHREGFQKHPSRRPMGYGRDLYAQRKSGSTFPVEISLNHFIHGDQPLTMALITDITARKKAEKEALIEKSRAQTYLDMAETLFVVTDADHRVTLINKKATTVLGVDENVALDHHWIEDYVASDDGKKVRAIYDELVRESPGTIRTSSFPLCDTAGNKRMIAWHHIRLEEDEGNPGSILSSGEDITEQHAYQEKLRIINAELESRVIDRTRELEKSQRLYSTIARNFPNGTINVLDRDLAYVFVEGKELYKLGITSKDLIGTPIAERLPVQTADRIVGELQEVFDGKPRVIEVAQRGNYYVLNAVPLSDTNGQINQILVVEHNVTAQKKAEDDMQQALHKEKQLNELKTRFVSMASHEFRTPLATILSSSGLIEKHMERAESLESFKEKVGKHFHRIRSNVNNLTGILNDFLSLDKLEGGLVRVVPKAFSILQLEEDLVEEFGHMTREGQVIDHVHEGEDQVVLDEQMVRNILNNLISNAIKYSGDHSTIFLRSRLSQDTLTIEIEDQGIGIPESDMDHMFERFFRARNATNIQGTGLGLNIVKRYVDLLHGEVSLRSEQNKGTIFILSFPRELPNEKENPTHRGQS
ncbi:MAG: PAS domain S-box protein [Flavobacteriales bacterium]|nr:PAS domain S-box protein [Flavobacteriales bacterium]